MKTIALYDGECSLCKESKRIFEKLDSFQKVHWISLQEYEQVEQAISFNKIDLRKELHIITTEGKVLKGFYAVRYLLLFFPVTIIVGALLFVPFTSLLGKPIYKWVAKNRHRFLKKKCDNGNCSL